MEKDKVPSLTYQVDKYARSNRCILCGKKMDSPCNSHAVPEFVLKEISENGKVAYGYSLSKLSFEGAKKVTGINNAHTFRLICNECDGKFFANYEQPDNLLNFDNLSDSLKNRILCEMAVKAHLSRFNMKYKNLIAKDMSTNGLVYKFEQEKRFTPERIDMNEQMECIESLFIYVKRNNDTFLVLHNILLDYRTKIASQTIINFDFDLNGKRIFNSNDLSPNNKCRYFYLMILPYKNHTRLLFYIDKNKAKEVDDLINQFNKLTQEEKLHFLFIALIAYSQELYMTPSLAKYIFEKDKKIIKFYMRTEKYDNYVVKVNKYKKYTNYLSPKFGFDNKKENKDE